MENRNGWWRQPTLHESTNSRQDEKATHRQSTASMNNHISVIASVWIVRKTMLVSLKGLGGETRSSWRQESRQNVNLCSRSQKRKQIVKTSIIEKLHGHELYLLVGTFGAISFHRCVENGIGPCFLVIFGKTMLDIKRRKSKQVTGFYSQGQVFYSNQKESRVETCYSLSKSAVNKTWFSANDDQKVTPKGATGTVNPKVENFGILILSSE